MSKYKKRRMLLDRLPDWDTVDLNEARHYYWIGDYKRAGKLIYGLSQRLIVEPLMDSEEYRNGERKPDTPFEEQEPQKVSKECIVTYDDLFAAGEIDPNAPQPERDDDGYLIR